MTRSDRYDVVIVGAGLSGLAAANELVGSGLRVAVLDQESPANLGGQAWWSFGGLFLVDSPEQRRLGVSDSVELAWSDWIDTAGFDREEDVWGRQWAKAYVEFAAGEKREWLRGLGIRFFPVVGWAERGPGTAHGPGNSVPRFHITWGTGPSLVQAFAERIRTAETEGTISVLHRHRVEHLTTVGGHVTGVSGSILVNDPAPRGARSAQESTGAFELTADAVIVCSGGIGGDVERVRRSWPSRLGSPPRRLLRGVPEHVDGRGIDVAEEAGAAIVNGDRMWHYTEGIANWSPVWNDHGIRILPGPSSLWLDPTGRRLPTALYPGADTLGTLEYLTQHGFDYSWLILTQRIIEKEFALSGSEQNPDLTQRRIGLLLQRVLPGAPGPVEAFKEHGADFIVADRLDTLLPQMERLSDPNLLDVDRVRAEIADRDAQVGHRLSKDAQAKAIRDARRYAGDRLIRVAPPHRLLDRSAGPLIAVRANLLTRKTLGGIQTDLSSRVLAPSGTPIQGLYAAGEAAGFGGGGMHGYRSLEGTFLGGCLFTGRTAGRSVAAELR